MIPVEEMLKKEDAWVRMIEISRKLWGQKLPDSLIKQFLNEYDLLKLEEQSKQQEHDARFNDSNGDLSDHGN